MLSGRECNLLASYFMWICAVFIIDGITSLKKETVLFLNFSLVRVVYCSAFVVLYL